MKEEFVTFEIAEKLKEKGYNKPFYFYYRTDDECIHHVNTCAPLVYSDKIDDEVVIAPTISQALKWLREEKKIHICIIMYEYTWGYTVYDLDTFFPEEFSSYYNTYEEATLAGIEFVLDNLI